MMEDKLTHDERVRLECIAQTNISSGVASGRPVSAEMVETIAARYERFVLGKSPSDI